MKALTFSKQNQSQGNRKKCTCPNISVFDVSVCFEPLGVANGLIPDTAITASSSLDDDMRPYNGRVLKASSSKTASRGCWCARKSDTAQYLQVDLRRSMAVTGTLARFLCSIHYTLKRFSPNG